MNTNVYERNGYRDRADYLRNMAEDYGLPLDVVQTVASVLGPEEDFDGLVCELNDLSLSGEYL